MSLVVRIPCHHCDGHGHTDYPVVDADEMRRRSEADRRAEKQESAISYWITTPDPADIADGSRWACSTRGTIPAWFEVTDDMRVVSHTDGS